MPFQKVLPVCQSHDSESKIDGIPLFCVGAPFHAMMKRFNRCVNLLLVGISTFST